LILTHSTSFCFFHLFSPLDVTLIPQEYGCSLPQPHGI
jgi:hypothetical protein